MGTESLTQRKENGLDLMKLLFSVCVVAIHTGPLVGLNVPPLLSAFYEAVVSLAVPFFFLACGYLLGKKIHGLDPVEAGKVLKKRTKSFVRLYVIWSLIYLPITVIYWLRAGVSPVGMAVSAVRGYLIVGQQYNSWMLWYLLATVYALIVLRLLLRWRWKSMWITVCMTALFLFGAVMDALIDRMDSLNGPVSLIAKLLSMTISEGRIFTGGIYLWLGISFASGSRRLSPVWYGALFVTGTLGKMLMTGVVENISLLVAAASLFPLILGIRLKDRPCYSVMRRMSTVIYFVHLLAWTVFYMVVYGQKTDGLLPFAATLLISGVIAAGVAVYERRRKPLPIF